MQNPAAASSRRVPILSHPRTLPLLTRLKIKVQIEHIPLMTKYRTITRAGFTSAINISIANAYKRQARNTHIVASEVNTTLVCASTLAKDSTLRLLLAILANFLFTFSKVGVCRLLTSCTGAGADASAGDIAASCKAAKSFCRRSSCSGVLAARLDGEGEMGPMEVLCLEEVRVEGRLDTR